MFKISGATSLVKIRPRESVRVETCHPGSKRIGNDWARPWLEIGAAMILRTIPHTTKRRHDGSLVWLASLVAASPSTVETLEKSFCSYDYASFAQCSMPSALSAGARLESSRIASLKS
jgi:hypothetical protein